MIRNIIMNIISLKTHNNNDNDNINNDSSCLYHNDDYCNYCCYNESFTIGLIHIKQSVTNLILLYAVDHIITRFQQK